MKILSSTLALAAIAGANAIAPTLFATGHEVSPNTADTQVIGVHFLESVNPIPDPRRHFTITGVDADGNTVNTASISKSIEWKKTYHTAFMTLSNFPSSDATYTVTLAAGASTGCTMDSRGSSCTSGAGAARTDASAPLEFEMARERPTVSVTAPASPLETTTRATFKLAWSEEVNPAVVSEDLVARYFVATTDSGAPVSVGVHDITLGRDEWTVRLKGTNGAKNTLEVREGAAKDHAGLRSLGGSATVDIRMPQSCQYEAQAPVWGACKCEAGATTGVRSGEIAYMIRRPEMFGGTVCPDNRVTTEACDCDAEPVSRGTCKGRCGESSGACSCSSDCIFSNTCCDDLNAECPSTVAEMTCNDMVECGTDILSVNGKMVCSCGPNCEDDDNCCGAARGADSFYSQCGNRLCATKFPRTDFCTREFDEATDAGQPCACDAGCADYGDCCNDFAEKCKVQMKCATPANCGYPMGTGIKESMGCWCEHSCLEMNDCCEDYEEQCEKQATCANGQCGSISWDDSDEYNPAGVEGAANRWCACDAECETYGDCCSDYSRECR